MAKIWKSGLDIASYCNNAINLAISVLHVTEINIFELKLRPLLASNVPITPPPSVSVPCRLELNKI